jgi:hypothetical protein
MGAKRRSLDGRRGTDKKRCAVEKRSKAPAVLTLAAFQSASGKPTERLWPGCPRGIGVKARAPSKRQGLRWLRPVVPLDRRSERSSGGFLYHRLDRFALGRSGAAVLTLLKLRLDRFQRIDFV